MTSCFQICIALNRRGQSSFPSREGFWRLEKKTGFLGYALPVASLVGLESYGSPVPLLHHNFSALQELN